MITVEAALKSDLGHLLDDILVPTDLLKDGTWHSAKGRVCGSEVTHPGHKQRIGDLKDSLCTKCLPRRWDSYWFGTPLSRIETLLELERSAKSLGKIGKSTSASAIQKRLVDAGLLSKRCTDLENVTGEIGERARKAKSRIREAEIALEKASRSDSTKEKLAEQVRKALVPKWYRGEEFTLDSSEKLIGVHPRPAVLAGRHGALVRAILEAYSIREGVTTVIVAPAYFYSFLLGALFFKGNETLVVSVDAPESPEAQENAAMLWDPLGHSTLACIMEAKNSGEALQ